MEGSDFTKMSLNLYQPVPDYNQSQILGINSLSVSAKKSYTQMCTEFKSQSQAQMLQHVYQNKILSWKLWVMTVEKNTYLMKAWVVCLNSTTWFVE